jgi:hypothetical protein
MMIVRKTGLWVCLAAAAVLAAGCAGKEITDLNGQLIQAQQEKESLRNGRNNTPDEAAVKRTQVLEQLERIADQAYAQAGPAADARAKISYYRIAVTADWQRGNERAVTGAREGTEICNTRNGFDIAPRDCAILLVVPNLLVNDLWIAKLNAPGGVNSAAPDFVARGREVIAGLVQAYNGVNAALSRVSGTGVSGEMVQVLQRQALSIKKNINVIGNTMLTVPRAEDRTAAREMCAFVRSEAPAALPSRCLAV